VDFRLWVGSGVKVRNFKIFYYGVVAAMDRGAKRFATATAATRQADISVQISGIARTFFCRFGHNGLGLFFVPAARYVTIPSCVRPVTPPFQAALLLLRAGG
jgi:hypothetical protein